DIRPRRPVIDADGQRAALVDLFVEGEDFGFAWHHIGRRGQENAVEARIRGLPGVGESAFGGEGAAACDERHLALQGLADGPEQLGFLLGGEDIPFARGTGDDNAVHAFRVQPGDELDQHAAAETPVALKRSRDRGNIATPVYAVSVHTYAHLTA